MIRRLILAIAAAVACACASFEVAPPIPAPSPAPSATSGPCATNALTLAKCDVARGVSDARRILTPDVLAYAARFGVTVPAPAPSLDADLAAIIQAPDRPALVQIAKRLLQDLQPVIDALASRPELQYCADAVRSRLGVLSELVLPVSA